MNSNEIRKQFLDFFQSKQHKIVPSAPMVVKGDPTLMFTNAGMNQFKEIFLGHKPADAARIADTQKCLRVSGKHNDLEEVGHDTYHHTMFEMLGNWSFGDYFKKEAIEYAWELLVDVYGIDKSRLYFSVFEGDKKDKLELDKEAYEYWKNLVPEDQILMGSKKDNFWEMGEQGPCGPCSEIHIDIRSDKDRAKVPGVDLVNKDHPQVIEIWNLVFIEFNRKANGELEPLPNKHIDTGMGFERLCMVLQGKQSNYETDVFQPIIQELAKMAKLSYGENEDRDVALRVIADHIRAIAFSIADGQLPSNNKAGYVIRRILRRAVRYGYTFLNFKEAFMYRLIPLLVEELGETYPELKRQETLIASVIKQEEESFLRTLSTGLTLLNKIIKKLDDQGYKTVNGKEAFELYDTFGFPFDLTELILSEKGMNVSKREFDEEMAKQKHRSRTDAAQESSDWVVLVEDDVEEFVGYSHLETEVILTRYRKQIVKGKEQFQLVFNITPFYAESGGQIGDTGYIIDGDDKVEIIDTQKENNLIIHYTKKLPKNINAEFKAIVDKKRREAIANNHTATHLLHKALRDVLGNHVEQKGSLVTPNYLRFDFSHFQKLSHEEINKVERLVNIEIRKNTQQNLHPDLTMKEAEALGAMALFGEKYGDVVRVVQFGDSVELCGGTHVEATGSIGLFIINHESSIASGVRRIEAITADEAENTIWNNRFLIKEIKETLKNPKDILKGIKSLINQNKDLTKKMDIIEDLLVLSTKESVISQMQNINGVNFIAEKLDFDIETIRKLSQVITQSLDDVFLVFATVNNGKPLISVTVSKNLVETRGMNAGNIVRELAKEIKGGGGGQPFFATAGGKDASGIPQVLTKAKDFIK
jgi:alanyl-tRNA synthetase